MRILDGFFVSMYHPITIEVSSGCFKIIGSYLINQEGFQGLYVNYKTSALMNGIIRKSRTFNVKCFEDKIQDNERFAGVGDEGFYLYEVIDN